MNAPNTLAVINLLAVIHQDGGQHTHKVGVEQSCKDAQQKVLDMRKQAEVPLTVIHEPEFPTGAALQAQLGKVTSNSAERIALKLASDPSAGEALAGPLGEFPATNREKTLAEKIAEAKQRIAEGEISKEPLL